MIVDTQYLGALADQDAAAREKAGELSGAAVPIRVPTAVVWEAYTGLGNIAAESDATALRSLYERLLQSHSSLEMTPDIAKRAGELNGTHMNSDTRSQLDGADSVVAAHGLSLGEPVISNDSDFQDVEGLDVVTY
ncbi:PIN domain-containing protein [Halosegnis longus]|uniref:PIN domain-containing protein n=1 Tax=Halosegnis longus TaxID=2216012 RepID=A0AAJ4R7G4_9EURY|nr:PIN domain-containing protein [Halosegnis longus]RNJ25938.1 PIN domain-containing protein [Salella cibi]